MRNDGSTKFQLRPILWVYALVFFSAFGLTYVRSTKLLNTNLFDLACILDNSFRIFKGQIPYRDFFCPTTPGSYYIQAFLWKCYEPGILTLKLFKATANGVLSVVLLLFLRNLRTSWIASALCLLVFVAWSPYVLVVEPWFSSDSSAAFMIAALCLFMSLKTENFRWNVLVGFFSGCSVLFKQNDGFGCFFGAGLVLLAQNFVFPFRLRPSWKGLGYFLGGFLLCVAPFLFYYAFHQALQDL
ncbi:MAG: hypothetical protein HYY07_02575, partial [Elusimicrobia bacterium]|nr:hypothetical protein [Elusimicrobiota bacterium]